MRLVHSYIEPGSSKTLMSVLRRIGKGKEDGRCIRHPVRIVRFKHPGLGRAVLTRQTGTDSRADGHSKTAAITIAPYGPETLGPVVLFVFTTQQGYPYVSDLPPLLWVPFDLKCVRIAVLQTARTNTFRYESGGLRDGGLSDTRGRRDWILSSDIHWYILGN